MAFPSDADVTAHPASAPIATDGPRGLEDLFSPRGQLQSDPRRVVEEFRSGCLDRALDRRADATEVFVKNCLGERPDQPSLASDEHCHLNQVRSYGSTIFVGYPHRMAIAPLIERGRVRVAWSSLPDSITHIPPSFPTILPT